MPDFGCLACDVSIWDAVQGFRGTALHCFPALSPQALTSKSISVSWLTPHLSRTSPCLRELTCATACLVQGLRGRARQRMRRVSMGKRGRERVSPRPKPASPSPRFAFRRCASHPSVEAELTQRRVVWPAVRLQCSVWRRRGQGRTRARRSCTTTPRRRQSCSFSLQSQARPRHSHRPSTAPRAPSSQVFLHRHRLWRFVGVRSPELS